MKTIWTLLMGLSRNNAVSLGGTANLAVLGGNLPPGRTLGNRSPLSERVVHTAVGLVARLNGPVARSTLNSTEWLRPAVVALALLSTTSIMAEESFTVFMIGDSTMADKPVIPENPERGWGQLLPLYFGPSVRVENHAVNGRSSKSFRDEGRWQPVLDRMQPGDWVIIQFGHNDEKPDEARHTEPFGTYTENLRRYCAETLERGGRPILATPVVRRNFDRQGVLQPTHGDYPEAVRKLAEEIDVPLLEMTDRSRDLLVRLGKERSEGLFIWTVPGEYSRFPKGNTDNTHFNALGATRMCDLAIAEIRVKIPELAARLKTDR